jgi:hypothetical protein
VDIWVILGTWELSRYKWNLARLKSLQTPKKLLCIPSQAIAAEREKLVLRLQDNATTIQIAMATLTDGRLCCAEVIKHA